MLEIERNYVEQYNYLLRANIERSERKLGINKLRERNSKEVNLESTEACHTLSSFGFVNRHHTGFSIVAKSINQ